MAIKEIPLDFTGGLNTSKHPAYIGDTELQTYINAIHVDGTVRLDRRYIKRISNPVSVPTTDDVRGSGYGKYGELPFTVDSQKEQYVFAIGGDLYLVDLTSATFAYTKIAGSSYSIDNKDWFFAQFEDHIYGVQTNYGFGRKLIGKGSNNTGDWTRLVNPTAPTVAPVANVYAAPPTFQTLTGSSLVATPADTSQALTAPNSWAVVYNAPVGPVSIQVDITFASAVDASRYDAIQFSLGLSTQVQFLNLRLKSPLEATGYTANAQSWKSDASNNYTMRLANINRTTRANITGLSYTLFYPAATGTNDTIRFYAPTWEGVWLSIDSGTNPGTANPTLQPLVYEYTYYNSTTGFESLPSRDTTIAANVQNPLGEWRSITMTSSAQSGVNFIRVYRRITDAATGSVTRYRIGEVANGSPSLNDKFTLDEVLADPVFTPFLVPQTGYTAICTWQDRLCVAVGPLLYISRQGDPTSFTPVGTVYDPVDPARARTFYPDDTRSENIVGLVGQDALYIITDKSIRCLYGSNIDDWRLVRMPEAEGSHGNRTYCGYRNGVLVLTESGRLIYVNVDAGIPDEVSKKLHPRIGAPGMQGSRIVALRPEGEIEVRGENGRYFILDIFGTWRSGVHTHPSHSVLYIPSLPIRWIGLNGNLYEGGDDSYVTDGGTTGVNGTPVTWLVRSKKLIGQRVRVKEIYFGDTPQTVVAGSLVYPLVTVEGENGARQYKPSITDKTCKIFMESRGNGVTLTIEGDLNTIFQGSSMRYEIISRAANK